MAVGIVVGACGGGSVGDPDPPRAPSGEQAASLLAFTSPAIGGGTIDGAKFEGRPTLLWFWSPW